MKYKKGCILCGEELKYYQDEKELNCVYCGEKFKSNVTCMENHYVCDGCHGRESIDYVYKYALRSLEENPINMFNDIIKSPVINLHGPEHHVIVPIVLLSAYYNKIKKIDIKEEKLKIAYNRGKKVPGGICGNYGACGSALGVGIFFSIIQETTPLSIETWGTANSWTGEILMELGSLGGPRCCKRNGYLSIIKAIEIVNNNFDMNWVETIEKPICFVKKKNIKTCLKSKCPFFLKE